MVVPKADGTVRICGDYKSTINQSVEDEQHVSPTTQDLYTALVCSKVFSKLDLSHDYAQLNVDKESQEYLTIAYSQRSLFIPKMVGTSIKVIKVYHNRNASLYSSPCFPCTPMQSLVYPCIPQ